MTPISRTPHVVSRLPSIMSGNLTALVRFPHVNMGPRSAFSLRLQLKLTVSATTRRFSPAGRTTRPSALRRDNRRTRIRHRSHGLIKPPCVLPCPTGAKGCGHGWSPDAHRDGTRGSRQPHWCRPAGTEEEANQHDGPVVGLCPEPARLCIPEPRLSIALNRAALKASGACHRPPRPPRRPRPHVHRRPRGSTALMARGRVPAAEATHRLKFIDAIRERRKFSTRAARALAPFGILGSESLAPG